MTLWQPSPKLARKQSIRLALQLAPLYSFPSASVAMVTAPSEFALLFLVCEAVPNLPTITASPIANFYNDRLISRI